MAKPILLPSDPVHQVWFVTNDRDSPEGYYVGASTRNKAKAIGANDMGCDYNDVMTSKIKGRMATTEGVLCLWEAQCFLCGSPYLAMHDPMEVPPACDSCCKTRPGTKQLNGNNL